MNYFSSISVLDLGWVVKNYYSCLHQLTVLRLTTSELPFHRQQFDKQPGNFRLIPKTSEIHLHTSASIGNVLYGQGELSDNAYRLPRDHKVEAESVPFRANEKRNWRPLRSNPAASNNPDTSPEFIFQHKRGFSDWKKYFQSAYRWKYSSLQSIFNSFFITCVSV